ncbi:hypothetical protein [Aquipuribacter nitratireducens]|uniref:Uncharacterized protein n=1 Tax=Aquipuribacter nitratireducens TaxID=650104 RepID=A0ABW0GJ29_9MICO
MSSARRLLPAVATAACAAVVTAGLAGPATASHTTGYYDYTSEVVVYDADSGRQVTIDLTSDASTSTLADRRWSTGWDHVVALDHGTATGRATLLYNSTSGRYAVVNHLPDGRTGTLAQGQWSRGWDEIIAVFANRYTVGTDEVLLLDSETGRVVALDTSRLWDGRGFRTLSDDVAAPRGTDVLRGQVGSSDTSLATAGLLYYDSVNGWYHSSHTDDRRFPVDGTIDVRERSAFVSNRKWSAGWTYIETVESDGSYGPETLFYNPATGRAVVRDRSGIGIGSQQPKEANWGSGWKVTVVEIDNFTDTEVILYNPDTGRTLIAEIEPDATLRVLSERTWSTGWDAITAIDTEFAWS